MSVNDDSKWWINTGLIALSLILVFLTLYNRFSGRPLDNVAITSKRLTSDRVSLGLQTFTSEGEQLHLSERDLIEMEQNAIHYRTAYDQIHSSKASTYECPWGSTCPADRLKQDMTALKHINYAYNATRKAIFNRAKNRGEKYISSDNTTIDDTAFTYKPISTQIVMC